MGHTQEINARHACSRCICKVREAITGWSPDVITFNFFKKNHAKLHPKHAADSAMNPVFSKPKKVESQATLKCSNFSKISTQLYDLSGRASNISTTTQRQLHPKPLTASLPAAQQARQVGGVADGSQRSAMSSAGPDVSR